ncbi:MAG: ATPase domain-containing protein, partial [Candidatus Hodarchaeota archaeon]
KNILDYRKEAKYHFTTGSRNFDKVLSGGFQSKQMYLIFGANKTGKTQICHQMCIQAFKQNFGTIYIDTENTFRPERIKELAIAQSLDHNRVLKKILVSKIMSTSAMLLKLNEVKEILEKNKNEILIVDSINNHFRVEMGDKSKTFHQVRNTFMRILEIFNNLTNRFNLITIATAQVTPNFNDKDILREYPVGLTFLSQYFSEFIYLSYKEKEEGYAHLINSYLFPEKKILYKISNKGIEDYKI